MTPLASTDSFPLQQLAKESMKQHRPTSGMRTASFHENVWCGTWPLVLSPFIFQACGIPEASEAAVRCQLQVLLAEVLSLDALFLAAADRQPVTMANDWLLGKVASLNMQAAGSYARFLVQQYGSAPAALQHVSTLPPSSVCSAVAIMLELHAC